MTGAILTTHDVAGAQVVMTRAGSRHQEEGGEMSMFMRLSV